LNRYLIVVGLLIVGILAIVSVSFTYAQNSHSNVISDSTMNQAAFFSTTISQGYVTMTEILVNTSIHFPLTDQPTVSWPVNVVQFAMLAFLLYMIALVLGFRFAKET
jgi:disulfide bond formation protein DsbB